METQLLSVKQTAGILGITEIHLRKLLNDGKIPFVNLASGKVRKSIRIEKRVIDEFVRVGGVKSE